MDGALSYNFWDYVGKAETMRKILLLCVLLAMLSGCAPAEAPEATPVVRETPNSDRTDFELVGYVTQAEEEFIIVELYLYEASGEPSGTTLSLASLEPEGMIPGYETRAILLDEGVSVWYIYDGELFEVDKSYLYAGQSVGVSAAGESMSIVIYG